jgi:hypothetical protein
MSSKFSFILLFATFWLSSCQSDGPKTPVFEKDNILGRWEISKAWRNGKTTETLTGTYYEFDEAGTMKTNLTPTTMEQVYEYSLSGNEIKQKGEPPITYTIDSLTPNFLAMNMVINNFPFKLELNKALPPSELEANDSSAQDSLKEL